MIENDNKKTDNYQLPIAIWQIKTLFSRQMLVSLLMGFSCGLPLLLTGSLLQAWLKEAHIDLAVIGLTNLVGLPYTWKFIWAPLFDRFTPKFLGRRRGWMLIAQLALIVAILALGWSDPAQHFMLMAIAACAIAFFSASQDIVVDAYRREDLADAELGLGSSLYIAGYRMGMLLASGGGLIMADLLPYPLVYSILSSAMLIGVVTTLFTPEPKINHPDGDGQPELTGTMPVLPSINWYNSIIEPIVEYLRRPNALWILAFILLYKAGDALAAAITTPFYLDLGFSKTEIGAVVKLFGFWMTIGGAFIGGTFMLRLGIYRALWVFGILQAVSTAGFMLLARLGHHPVALAGVIAFENLSGGLGTAAFVAFMASQTNKQFTATQYALLSSLMAVPRVILSSSAGWLAKGMGWETYFLFCTLCAAPGLLLLFKIYSPGGDSEIVSKNLAER